jgi:hypothetical protein
MSCGTPPAYASLYDSASRCATSGVGGGPPSGVEAAALAARDICAMTCLPTTDPPEISRCRRSGTGEGCTELINELREESVRLSSRGNEEP